MHILGDLNRLAPDIRGIRVTVRDIDLCHPDVLAAVLQRLEVHIVAGGAVEVRAEQIGVCKCLCIAEDVVVEALAVLEALRRHQLRIGAFRDLFAVIRKEADHVIVAPVGPLRSVVRLVLDRDGIQVDALSLHVLDVAVQVLRVVGEMLRGHGILSAAAVVAGIGGRVPRGREHGRTERLCALRSRDSRFPRIAVIADIDPEDREAKLIGAVSERLLDLCIGHVTLRDPLRQVDAAEAADGLIGLAGVHTAVARCRDASRLNAADCRQQHDAADCRRHHLA